MPVSTVPVLDANGNPLGAIRTPYVDVSTANYAASNAAADPPIPNPSAELPVYRDVILVDAVAVDF